ncbi:hypothetical protein LBMAG52_09350 [Planctomycetia bacterium]|nr:hypothetical protein LBMAG52_09350 [Planctomycetia bacterium]
MEVVNDARLMELVREPARELLPATRLASVVQPLVVLLAFVPGLLGFWNRSLDEATCRQGLLAFDVVAGERPIDWFVTASREAAESSRPAFPLATLLTALGLRVDLLSPESRLLLVSYLSSAVLLLCLGCLAKKVGGSRFALLTVCLACGHREFLALSESLPPVALSLAFVVLSFRAMLAHQSADGALLSWPLVASGLSLAASWLSGSEVALAGLGVMLVVSLLSVLSRKEPSARSSLKRVLRQRLMNLVIAVTSLLLVTVIAVAIVAGWQSAFSERVRLPNFSGSSFWFRRVWPVESRVAEAAQALVQMMGAWLGFVVLGVAQVARGRMPHRESTGGKATAFLVGWSAVAGLSWWATWPVHHGNWTNTVTWSGFLLLPLLVLATCGLDAVLRREFGLRSVVTVTLATLGVVSAPQWTERLPNSFTGSSIAASVLTVVIAVGVVVLAVRRLAKSETHSRQVLLSCVALLVLTDVTNGILSHPQLADDERELLAFRRQLVTENLPVECWLSTEETSPARLCFFLRSLWRDVALREAKDLEAVLVEPPRTSATKSVEPGMANAKGSPVKTAKPRAIVVTWGNSKLPVEELKRRGQTLTQVTAPHYFRGRLLKGYHWIERSEGSSSR